jgi:molybdenum cofactor guanylyltransferase
MTMTPTMDKINGLVLAGGRSKRMGRDKTLMQWHGMEQRYYVAEMLKLLCDEVFISYRKDQFYQTSAGYRALIDTFSGIGPYGAILSAFAFQPDRAWLVVASDLPLLDSRTLEYLVSHRSIKHIATAFQSLYDGLPEPLITIWEPKSQGLLLGYLAQGYTCPRKALIMSENVHILQPPDPNALLNVNTPEDLATAEQIIFQNRT